MAEQKNPQAQPELSLSELAAEFDPPVSKSCLNHRLRKLLELSRDLSE
jgi:DNA-binding transcriptional regulator WhiA